MVGEAGLQPLDDQRLCLQIHLSDDVADAFVASGERSLQPRTEQLARLAGSGDGHLQSSL